MLSDFTAVANAIAQTTKKSVKERLLADYLASLDDASLERAVVFFSGSPFPRRDERVTGIGGAAISDAVAEVTGRSTEEIWASWSKYGDAGDTVAEHFPDDPSRTITLSEVGEHYDRIAAAATPSEKKRVLAELLRKVDAQGARFIVKILGGELRIGLQEGLVESAVAKAFGRKLEPVRRANMFTGDIGATALLAKSDALESAKMSLFHPFAFMLAQPEEDPEEIVAALGVGAFADDKYDGIRAQIHTEGDQIRIYSRTLDNVTHRFPEIEAAAKRLGHSVILDGEIVAFSDRILPFALIQTRLGRKKISEKLLAEAPVAFFAFDLVFFDGEPLFEIPLHERLARMRAIVLNAAEIGGATPIRLSDQSIVRDAAHVDQIFDIARARANEGLVVKDPNSFYTPGRRGKSWLKYKKALATLDCVVTYAEYGHGKRRGVLSDVTFAVSRDGELVNIGKAYSGLTDAEIAQLTEHFQKTTIERYGSVLKVEPQIILEIAFDRIQESKRHKSGYAMRFPRIARIRDDKTIDQISTIDEVRRIYEGQLKREEGSKSEE
ncbi:MAG TPA: ATP-dependent DNA ligase [Thermoanaerobaculia bacterium]|jgi:DNA ligase-1|nr:ATP-dependent DNA ligase [Thermoanaerobaculia bacterium]